MHLYPWETPTFTYLGMDKDVSSLVTISLSF